MQNYFNYFTEIEAHFQRRRGTLLLLSTLDWALIETWREAGVPLAAVLRGIDDAFNKYDARPNKTRARKVNGLAWCAQAVVQAVEEMQEAAVGISSAAKEAPASGLEQERIAAYLRACAVEFHTAAAASPHLDEFAKRLDELAAEVQQRAPKLEDLERTLSVIEEKLFAMLLSHTPEDVLVTLREQSDRELAPFRARMQTVQLRQIERQFLHKRLLDRYKLPRISLFYMPQS